MPFINEWKNNGLHRKFYGKISGKEVLKSNLSIQGDQRFDSIKYVFNDFTQIDDFKVSEINITEISTIDKIAAQHSEKLKIIIVATDESLLEWAQLYLKQMENSPFNVVIFNDIENALNSIP